jgi:FkbM family methyltransferase
MEDSLIMLLVKKTRRFLRVIRDHVRTFGVPGLFYLLQWIIGGKKRLLKCVEDGKGRVVYLRIGDADASVYCQIFLDREYDIIKGLKDPTTIVDAGANIGLTSIFMSRLYPHCSIHALEPEVGNYEMLEMNTKGYPNIHCLQAALWKEDGPVKIVSADCESWAFRITDADDWMDDAVRGYRLSTLLNKMGVERLSLLKMDIEGGEFDVLGDASDWLCRVDSIVAELHDRMRPGCEALFGKVTAEFSSREESGELVFVSR